MEARAGQADGALQCLRQRIVAAGIEHHDADGPRLLQIGDDLIDPLHATQVRLVGELGLDRHQIIDAGELHGVAAVVQQRDIGIADGARKRMLASSMPALSRSRPTMVSKPSA